MRLPNVSHVQAQALLSRSSLGTNFFGWFEFCQLNSGSAAFCLRCLVVRCLFALFCQRALPQRHVAMPLAVMYTHFD